MQAFENSRVLITGGLGFIGANLAHRLVSAGARVMLVDSLIPEYGGNLFNISGIENRVAVNISDVRDEHAMRYLVQKQDYLFNLAGQTSHLDSMHDPYTDLEINSRAQLYILEACRYNNPGIRIVFASTRQVYGTPQYLPVDEKHALRPVDVNGINKVSGEQYHLLYNNVYDLWSCALRLTNTYGPCMRIKDTRQTFLGIWIRKLLEGEAIEVWGGEQLRDFTYVDDVVTAIMMAATNEKARGQVFNLGGLERFNLGELAKLIINVNGSGDCVVRSFPQDRQKIDIGDYYADFALIRDTLGWQPQIGFTEGIEKTLDYYRRHLTHYI